VLDCVDRDAQQQIKDLDPQRMIDELQKSATLHIASGHRSFSSCAALLIPAAAIGWSNTPIWERSVADPNRDAHGPLYRLETE